MTENSTAENVSGADAPVEAAIEVDWPRFAAFLLTPVASLVLVAIVLAAIVWRQLANEGPPPASEEFFWLSLAIMPLALLGATWLRPRRIGSARREVQIETPDQVVSVALFDDIRLACLWAIVAAFSLFALAAAAVSIIALTNCSVNAGTCAGIPSHRFTIYGLVMSCAVPIVLLASQLTARLRFIRDASQGPGSPVSGKAG